MSKPRCSSCRWWQRSYNFAKTARDWGDCHFWGQKYARNAAGAFIDGWRGASPRGSDTCAAHNLPPELIGTLDPQMDGPMNPRGDE